MLAALTVFVLMVVLDFFWAQYTIALQQKKLWYASGTAGCVYLVNGAVTLHYVSDPWMLIPAVLGAVVGTYAGARITTH